MCCKLTLLTT